eukprot:4226143-Pyramimonas_sp.AAC.2
MTDEHFNVTVYDGCVGDCAAGGAGGASRGLATLSVNTVGLNADIDSVDNTTDVRHLLQIHVHLKGRLQVHMYAHPSNFLTVSQSSRHTTHHYYAPLHERSARPSSSTQRLSGKITTAEDNDDVDCSSISTAPHILWAENHRVLILSGLDSASTVPAAGVLASSPAGTSNTFIAH